jgi:hypothetical protein
MNITLKERTMTTKTVHLVNLIEHERGWGSRIDEVKEFPTEQEAMDYVVEFNSKNIAQVVPDWYMVAEYAGTKEVEAEDEIELNPEEVKDIILRLAFALECRVPEHPIVRLARNYLKEQGLLS